MVKRLIEEGVDPNHTDPFGNTARDKAKLYQKYKVEKFLEHCEQSFNPENKRDFSEFNRSNKFRTFLNY